MSSFPIHLTRLLEAVIPLTDLQPSGVPPAGAGAPGAGRHHRLEDDGEARIRHLDPHCASLQHGPLVRYSDLHLSVQMSVVLFSRSSAFIMLGTHSCRGPGVSRYKK